MLLWLMNLGFAGGGAAEPPPPEPPPAPGPGPVVSGGPRPKTGKPRTLPLFTEEEEAAALLAMFWKR